MVEICSGFLDAGGLMYSTILPLAGSATIFALIVLIITYYIATIIDNPKVLTWVKTELVQLVVSFSAVVIILATMNLFCSINAGSIKELLGTTNAPSRTIFEEAKTYLINTTMYGHHAVALTRYYLSSYSIIISRSAFECDLKYLSIGCLFGGSGTNQQPLAYFSGKFSSLSMMFGTTFFYFLTSANMLFILLFTYKGFVLFFLPIAIILRSLPYLRNLGSLLIAVCMSFFIIYPLVLTTFSIATEEFFKIYEEPSHLKVVKEEKFESVSSLSEFFYGSIFGTISRSRYVNNDMLIEDFFVDGKDDYVGVLQVIGVAFVISFVLPSLALAITIASIHYFARFYGEDIDLSRISQMV